MAHHTTGMHLWGGTYGVECGLAGTQQDRVMGRNTPHRCALLVRLGAALTTWCSSNHRGEDDIATGAGLDDPRTRLEHAAGGKSRNG